MAQNHSLDITRLSISEEGPSPNLTSRTPPPPGFDNNGPSVNFNIPNSADSNGADSRSGTPNTCKSTSFNNLAMALGTGLAESMDDSTSQLQPPQRTFTPDNYTRQTRHSVSRLMGSSGGAASNAAANAAGAGGGFDYLNPGGTSHLLIPPANSSYLDKLKGQQQQQQPMGGGLDGNNNNNNNNNNMFSATQQQGGGNNIGNNQNQPTSSLAQASSSLAQASTSLDQKPVRFTAAMMANNAQSGNSDTSFGMPQASGNNVAGVNNNASSSNGPSPILSSANSHQLNQELLRQQLMQQSSLQQQSAGGNNQGNGVDGNNNNINFGRSNSNNLGVTVVEPNSARNSPAPQRGQAAAMIGVNGDGLLYPLMMQQGNVNSAAGSGQQQHQQQLSQLSSGANFVNGNVNAPNGSVINFVSPGQVLTASSGGRASAPPPPTASSQRSGAAYIPGGMTTMVMNNAAIRAYTASSLQMRVAELHQELGGNNVGVMNGVGGAPGARGVAPGTAAMGVPMAGAPGQTVTLRSMPAGAIPIVLAPTPTPPAGILRPPSRGGDINNNNAGAVLRALSCEPPQVVDPRSSTPMSTITNITPNPTATVVIGGQMSQQPMQMQMQMQMQPRQVVSQQQQRVVVMPAADPEQQEKERKAVEELKPFLNKSSSKSSNNNNASTRGLAILYASSLHVPDVRSTCEAFGALESFRPDFGESKGVFFATFYDLRSAQLAVGEMPDVLNKQLNKGSGGRVEVKYCVPLNSSAATDESMIMLSNLPHTVDEQDLNHVLSSFGEVRAIHYQANVSEEDEDGNELTSYLVEFYDVQDARQALLELEQTNPWGDAAKVKVGTRSPTKRKQGKDLIMLMSCWRQGVKGPQKCDSKAQPQQQRDNGSVDSTVSPTLSPSPPQPLAQQQQQQETASSQTARTSHVHHHQTLQHQMDVNQNNTMNSSSQSSYYQQYPAPQAAPGPQQYQLVVGPDGQYSYVMVNHSPHHPQIVSHPYGHQMGQMVIDPHHQQQQQHIMYAPIDQQYMMHNAHLGHNTNPAQQYHIQYNGGAMPGTSYGMPAVGQVQLDGGPPTPFIRMPSNDVNSSSLSSSSQSPAGRKGGTSSRTKSTGSIGSGSSGNNSGGQHRGHDEEHNNLALSIDDVRTGKDHRSSLMVRNIPNKYTQQMLLAEFAAAGHGPMKMDFFYLPIDFKNKCNRGYAFVNFVDYRDICAFFDEYNGTGWKRFNSDKICDITYARIQGKAAMLKRFENSALMEKDDEYRPKVFVSHGERKGEIENMPGIMIGGGGVNR